jgi:polar amino acid transport system substrate-binding protein
MKKWLSSRTVSLVAFVVIAAGILVINPFIDVSAQTQSGAVALVPKAVRDNGVLRVGSQQTFPPVEFKKPGETEVVGVSVDLIKEIAKRLGLRLEYIHGEYVSLIPGLEAGRFDIASGGISDTVEREQKVDFVNYMMSGCSILIQAQDAGTFKTIDDFCGRKMATLLGSNVIMAAVDEASKRCVSAGKAPITVEQLPSAPDARMQLDLKRVEGYLGDFPALAYMLSNYPGNYKIAGGNFLLTRYVTSWAFSKNNTGLRDAVQMVAKEMMKDGTYAALLKKWGLEGGALPEITVNLPATKRP